MRNRVVYATDDNYWMPLYVSVYSLLSNNTDESFEIFIIANERDSTFDKRVPHLEDVHPDFELDIIEVGDTELQDAPEPKWFSKGIYYRLFVGSQLSDITGNVLYLDCDTIVDGSISELFETPLNEYAVAAVPEQRNKSFLIGLPIGYPFYNTGILYIDLDGWRAQEVEQQAIDYIAEKDDLRLPMQQVLNTIFYKEDLCKPLSPKYNTSERWSESIDRWNIDTEPTIIHYTGADKPWLYQTRRQHKDLWWEYLEQTPYRDYTPPNKTIQDQTRKILKRVWK